MLSWKMFEMVINENVEIEADWKYERILNSNLFASKNVRK